MFSNIIEGSAGLLIPLIWLALKIGLALVVIYFSVLVGFHLRALHRLRFYERQRGVTLFPGCRRLIFGNDFDLMEYGKVCEKGEEVVCDPHQWMAHSLFPKVMGMPEGKRFEANEYPIIACNFLTVPSIWVSDPDIVKDIFIGKNATLERHPIAQLIFQNGIGQSFLISKGDELWKKKRKACAHAFYKDRLQKMLEILNTKLTDTFTLW